VLGCSAKPKLFLFDNLEAGLDFAALVEFLRKGLEKVETMAQGVEELKKSCEWIVLQGTVGRAQCTCKSSQIPGIFAWPRRRRDTGRGISELTYPAWRKILRIDAGSTVPRKFVE